MLMHTHTRTNTLRRRVRVFAMQEMPYVMVRTERNLTGNDRYEGFCIDLLKAIAGKCQYILIHSAPWHSRWST